MFETVVARLATVPNRRKTVVFISTGVPIDFGATRDCPLEQKDRMLEVFARASRANINIYSIDPGGYGGYERYLQDPIRRAGRPAPTTVSDPTARSLARLRRDFLEIMAGYTGASATVNSDEIETGIDRIFTEASSYYLLGYQTSNGKPDGKYRKVEVKVKRPGTTVRTRSGYFAPKDAGTARDAKDTPAVNDLGLVGLMNSPALPLRAAAVPVALSGPGRDADVAVVLSVRVPSPRGPVPEAVTVVRNLYDSEGRAGPPVLEKTELTLLPSTGDELRYDLYLEAAARSGPVSAPAERDEQGGGQERDGVRRHRRAGLHARAAVALRHGARGQGRTGAEDGRARWRAADHSDSRARLRAGRQHRRIRPGVSRRRRAVAIRRHGRAGVRRQRPQGHGHRQRLWPPTPSAPDDPPAISSTCRSASSSTGRTW